MANEGGAGLSLPNFRQRLKVIERTYRAGIYYHPQLSSRSGSVMGEQMTQVLIGTGLIVAAASGVAVFVLWLRDRFLRGTRFVDAFLGWIALLAGQGILLWLIVLLARSDEIDWGRPLLVLIGFILPVIMIIAGWYWVRGEYKGIQDFRIDPDSPELQDSVLQARAQLPRFVAHVKQHTDPAYVRFALVTRAGRVEHVWAHVRKVQHGKLDVSVLPNPGMTPGDFAIEREVMESEVEDWQILNSDGCISGAFSTIASYRYLENRGVRLSRMMRKQKAKLLDA